MGTRGIDTGTGRPEDYISRVETARGLSDDGGGPKMPDLRNVRSEPPPETKPRRGSFLDTVKDALRPGDIRTGKASPGAWEGQQMESSSPSSSSTSPKQPSSISQQAKKGWHTVPGTKHQQQHQHQNYEGDGVKLFETPLSVPEHHHAHERHRSHGVMDHLLGRRRSHDDPSGIIGSRRERAELSTTKSTGPGVLGEDQSYTFDVPRGSKEDPKRSAVDAVPRASALDMDEAMSHEFAVSASCDSIAATLDAPRGKLTWICTDLDGTRQTRGSVEGTGNRASDPRSKNAISSSQYLTDSGLYE
ncbi:hypothetical protein PG996_007862 [Apiospora saccharicola]|uniref:Uncharacterized protein n=1 Tax=Apiospora saccharicola TaxID=335842 RepID=A0ABR1UW99_9PEZI